MEQIRNLDQLLVYAREVGPKKLSVACAEDDVVMKAVEEARALGIVNAILVGNGEKIKAVLDKMGLDAANYEIVDEKRGPAAAALKAVELVSTGQADVLMKGMLETADFLRGVLNPLGMKVGPNHDADEVLRAIGRLNPANEPGRMTLITRFGARAIEKNLTPLLRAVKREGMNVVWCCDPMHANTFSAESGRKTRNFDDILSELHCFFELNWAEGSIPGGVHFELTGDDVTECIGGARHLSPEQLGLRYLTTCDPRLNAEQSLEMAFQIAELIRS